MTPAEIRYWQRAQRKVASLQPDVAAGVLRAFAILRDSLTDAQLLRLVESGAFELAFSEIFDAATMDRAMIPVRQRIRSATEESFKFTTADLPKGGKVKGVIGVMFDHLDPKVIEAVRALDVKVSEVISQSSREVIRAFVENGLRDGVNPRVIARELRSTIGLAPNQELAVRNYELALRGSGRNPFDYALRDRRFDATVRAASAERGTILAYHGTDKAFTKFDPAYIGKATDEGFLGRGFYFSTDANVGRTSAVTMEVRLRTGKTLELSYPQWGADKQALVRDALGLPRSATATEVTTALRARGYTAVSLDYAPVGYAKKEFMVYDAKRIKIGGGLTEEQIARMTDAYRRRMLAFHAETISRTATLDAFKLGQKLSWDDAIAKGIVDGDRLQKQWIGVGDSRERPEHVAMNDEVVGADEPYSNGEQIPGESTYNCRCLSRFFVSYKNVA